MRYLILLSILAAAVSCKQTITSENNKPLNLDSIKQVVSWAKENMELSGLKDIRWVVEDALTFAKREVKRGKKYNGIILDPPAFAKHKDVPAGDPFTGVGFAQWLEQNRNCASEITGAR